MINLLGQTIHCPQVTQSAPVCAPHGNQRAWHFCGKALPISAGQKAILANV